MGDANSRKIVGCATRNICQHILECDRMYHELYGVFDDRPRYNACRKLLKMGYELNDNNMPKICIEFCERWRLPSEERPQIAKNGYAQSGLASQPPIS